MSKNELYGKYWLLTYENAATQWLRTRQDYVKRDSRFGYLMKNGVRFYNENAASEYRPAKRPLIVYDVSG
jgi:hypothetical protein